MTTVLSRIPPAPKMGFVLVEVERVCALSTHLQAKNANLQLEIVLRHCTISSGTQTYYRLVNCPGLSWNRITQEQISDISSMHFEVANVKCFNTDYFFFHGNRATLPVSKTEIFQQWLHK